MTTNLFEDFDPISSKQWKQKIQFELKGADYNDTLIWNSPEDIKVKPFYHSDDLTKTFKVNTHASQFKICQNIFVFDVEKSIERAMDTLARGAESIRFTIEDSTIDIVKLLQKLPLETIPVYFHFNFISIDFVKKIDAIAIERKATIYCNLDPIGQLAQDGNWFSTNEKSNFETLELLSKATKNSSLISINSTLYQNAGATIVQQIAYTLSHANEYFNRLDSIQTPIVLQVAVGTNYFFEIAKLRAIRVLFNLIAKEYNHNLDCHIIVTPTKRNKTIYDYNVNMLRTTTECMSAILGGADAIANLPYDALYHKDNEFGDRIARNQLLILKNESYFDKVDNPADGSYYIESLTNQLAEKALTLFKTIEENGGFLKQLNDGTIKRKIQESADTEQKLFDSGKEILLGTNKYPNKNDRMKTDLELFPFVKVKSRKTLISPIIEKRLAEKIEQERLESE
ncbi:methylmalonyl-CoA mutase subunit beta [Flavobacterium sp. F-380]|uniref:Methylmalonyl-CoA mutase subunit beta n=1 Tax=Flavobacterium kayseriense TaxID=2764714 RepID=A0ABR7J3R7_9FLAO|nr:methylmalonyl-CoA mutase subunit beta [Flavobacterium kayseriense]MBC5839842.1 methylmalonyl-CoA mutase subunit beta [Flavobacterium kayseriense]MBC5847488.1 methylmalonyl-CoA mutase subunit beta [Flavobacterium kayseriense]MBU0941423.1 methylmalonyl-CoA mutase subunit beta [Bacteroidota bacterium]